MTNPADISDITAPVISGAPVVNASFNGAADQPRQGVPSAVQQIKTRRQEAWDRFNAEDFNIGTIPGMIAGGMIPDILMALFGPWIYGDAHVSAYFNVFSGVNEAQHRFDNTPVTTPTTDSIVSDAAFENMAERFPTPVIRPFS